MGRGVDDTVSKCEDEKIGKGGRPGRERFESQSSRRRGIDGAFVG